MIKVPLRLVVKNLLRHPVRSILTVLSLAVAVFLLCLLRSLVVSLDAGVREARSDRLIVQSAVSLFVYIPQSYDTKIRQVEGVEDVCSWTWFGGYYQEQSNFFAQFAVDSDRLLSMYPEMVLVEGSEADFLADRRGCLIGDQLASAYGFKLGDSIPIIGSLFPRTDGGTWDFQVKGIYTSTSSNVDRKTLFFHYKYLQESRDTGAASGPSNVAVFVVRLMDGARPEEVMARIDALFENGPQRVQTTTEAAFQAQFVSMVGNIPLFVSSLGGGVFLAILLAVINTMLMAAREQVQDSGIMKALGFTNLSVFLVLLLQSLLLALAGGGLGILAALGVADSIAEMIGSQFPGFAVTGETVLLAATLSIVIGLVAGLTPGLRLGRLNVAQSMRAEV